MPKTPSPSAKNLPRARGWCDCGKYYVGTQSAASLPRFIIAKNLPKTCPI